MFSKFIRNGQTEADAGNPPAVVAPPVVDWGSRLEAAIGNDGELLALAIEAPSIDHKLAAVQALVTEEALRTAEREFRKHDRRVHTLAKQRLDKLVRQRTTRGSADELLEVAAALLDAAMIPANRLVELNQAWELLDGELLDAQRRARFAEMQAALAELVRGRGEHKRAGSRWSTAANTAKKELARACADAVVADGEASASLPALGAASEAAQAVLNEMPEPASVMTPEDRAYAALAADLRLALSDARAIAARLALLEELQGDPVAFAVAASDSAASPALARWQGLPLLIDASFSAALNARFEAWTQRRDETSKQLQKQNRQRLGEKEKAARQARVASLTAKAEAVEAALAAGHLGEAGKLLAGLQSAIGKDGSGAGAALTARAGALQAEFSRLRGWQQWGGGRVRDDLVLEAEALAASTIVVEGARPPKLPVKQLENSIDKLRARWKELDRLGGATSKPLWQRFDAALKTAYIPVAAHLARLHEARQANLVARSDLLTVLEGVAVEDDCSGKTPDWKEVGRALAHFQTEWRKLGPLEHTVPHKAQAALFERMKAGVARLENPLRTAQASAQSVREQLIARARALSDDAQSRDLMTRLRELQQQWQSHARSQPLPRKTENLLWAQFKAATDAVMSLREAANSARDAELKAHQSAREALIAQLAQVHEDTAPADIKRLVAAVDAAWRKVGEAPRNQSAKLDARYRAAREQALEHIAGSAERSWQRTCDALLAKLALCEEVETMTVPPPDIEARWAELPTLPARWEKALQARWRAGDAPSNAKDKRGEALEPIEPFDTLLLQLESALDIPSPEAFQFARRTLKLLAMKNAMEGRRSAAPAVADVESLSATAFGQPRIDATQRQRLLAIIAALRAAGATRLRS